jgi:asparagine synthase (glutamine-hydrolysing)
MKGLKQKGKKISFDYIFQTFDLTTVRASTPMFLLARRVKATGCKMVLSGEGADEVFGGYLYFHKAPNGEELHKETVRKVKKVLIPPSPRDTLSKKN